MQFTNIPPSIIQPVEEIKLSLKRIYKAKLKNLILFGSYARGNFEEGSDIDILLLIENVKNIFDERKKLSYNICDICLKYDVLLSVIPYDFNEYNKLRTPFILNVKREGIIL
ncbi:MAG: nucleotidyltransferase domain-containing protein [Leptospiraceae bacterium]|nr:nucleotidyltransferase domain-containing protein [Leptospiraceae bacterium]MCP5496468.1 nucleotidyltransferase domain-containing protein [Leptospiraceae bacterium]